MSTKINAGTRHIMTLISRDKNAEGWTKVSKIVWPLVVELPAELVESKINEDGNGGLAKLTDNGEVIIKWT